MHFGPKIRNSVLRISISIVLIPTAVEHEKPEGINSIEWFSLPPFPDSHPSPLKIYKFLPLSVVARRPSQNCEICNWELRNIYHHHPPESKKNNLQRQTLAPSTPTVDMEMLSKLGKPYLPYRFFGLSRPFSRRGPLRWR